MKQIVDVSLELFMTPYRPNAFSMKKHQILDGGRSTAKTNRHITRMVLDSVMIPGTVSYVIVKDSTKIVEGIYGEVETIISRVSKGTFVRGKNGDYQAKKSPAMITFRNGSEIRFAGSKDPQSFKGKGLPPGKRWGFCLFDEFAEYKEEDALTLLDVLPPTFRSPKPEHEIREWVEYIWSKDDLDLSQAEYDSCGNLVYTEDPITGERKVKLVGGSDTIGMKFLYASNPPKSRNSWYYTEFLDTYTEKDENGKRKSKWDDVYYQNVNYVDVFEDLIKVGLQDIVVLAETEKKQNYKKFLNVWMGEPIGTEGLFLPDFDPMICRYDPINDNDINVLNRNWQVGVDFGVQNATTFVFMGLDSQGVRYIHKVFYDSNNETGNSHGSSYYSQELLNFIETSRKELGLSRNEVIRVFYDPSARAFANDVNFLIKKKSVKGVKLYKATNDRTDTLTEVRDIISEGRFKYNVHTPYRDKLEYELSNAENHPTKDDIVKKDDHLIDAIRYVAYKFRRVDKKQQKRSW